jgi:tetraacyldisaccharide 4'-kinase
MSFLSIYFELTIRFLLYPLTPIYKLAVMARNILFAKGILKIEKVNSKVVSIGNLTIGGSGKTPLSIYVAKLFKEKGLNVAILSRGYGRKTKGFHLVSDGNKIYGSVNETGDEIYMTAIECKVPCAVSESRIEGAKKLLSKFKLDLILLDDGFQHRYIYRDVDIVIFDQNFLIKSGSIRQQLLPTGDMRESFKALKRADAIIINRKFSNKMSLPIDLIPYFENKKIFDAHYEAIGIVDIKKQVCYDLQDFHMQNSLAVSGIANPESFFEILENNNITCSNKLIFRDHKSYNIKEIQKIRKKFYDTNSMCVLTTEKDAVKLKDFNKELDDIPIYYLKIEIKLDEKENFEKFLFDKLKLNNLN